MYHVSNREITPGTINSWGIAGECLFFSNNKYSVSGGNEAWVYEADFDCVLAFDLDDQESIAEIMNWFDVDEDDAIEMLTGENASDYVEDATAEDEWWLQGIRGEAARNMGFDGCQDRDENGTVYIVPMKNRESQLTLVEVCK